MAESGGTLKVEIVSDSSKFEIGAKRATEAAKKTTDEVKKAGEEGSKSFDKAAAAAKRFETSVIRQAQAIGKTKSELLAAKAASMGLSQSLDPYIRKLKEVEQAQAKASSGFASFGKVAAIGAAVTAMTGLSRGIMSVVDAADALNDMSQKIGVSVQSLAQFQLAAEQSGTSLETIAKGSKALGKSMIENSAAFKAAGVSTKDIKSAMLAMADVFASMEDGVEKTQLAVALFGKAGMDMIPMLNLGRKGMTEAAESAEDYAKAMARIAPMSDQFNDSLAKLGITAKTSGALMAEQLLPTLNAITDSMSEAASGSDLWSTAGKGLAEVFRTVAIVGSEVAFVISAIVKDMAAFIELSKKAATMDIQGALSVKLDRQSQAIKDRAALDTYQQRIMNPPSNPEATKRVIDPKAAETAQKLASALGIAAKEAKTIKAETTEAEKAQAAFVKVLEGERSARAKVGQAAQDKAAAMEKELENYGLLESAIYDKTVADLEEARILAMKEGDSQTVIDSLDQQIDAYKRLAQARRGIEALDVSKKAAEDASKEWEKFADDLERSLTDALMRSFEAGDNFGEAFVENLKNTLKTAALKVVVQAIVEPITGKGGVLQQMTGGGQAGGGSILEQLMGGSTGSSGLSGMLVSGAQQAFNTAAYSTLGGMGMQQAGMLAAQDAAFGMAGTAATLESAGTAMGAAASSMASYMPYIGAALQFASGDKKGAAFTAAGAAIGSFVPVIGTAVGAVIGSVVGSLFGSKPKYKRFGDTVNSTYSNGEFNSTSSAVRRTAGLSEGLTGVSKAFAESYGGLLSAFGKDADFSTSATIQGKKRASGSFSLDGQELVSQYYGKTKNTTFADMFAKFAEEVMSSGMKKAVASSTLPEIVKTIFAPLKDSADVNAALNATIAIQNTLKGLGSSLEEFAGTDSQNFVRGVETMLEALNRSISSLAATNPVLSQIGVAMFDLTMQAGDAASQLIALSGGIEAFGSKAGAYYDAFFSDDEKQKALTKKIEDAFASVNLEVPTSKDIFKSIVEGIDLTSEAGRILYATLMNIAPAFAQVADDAESAFDSMIKSMLSSIESAQAAIESISRAVIGERDPLIARILGALGKTDALRQIEIANTDPLNRSLLVFANALDDLTSASQSLSDAQAHAAAQLANAGSGIAQFIAALRVDIAPSSSGGVAGAYQADLLAARSGDIAASERIPASAGAYAEQIRNRSGTKTEADIALSRMARDLDALPATKAYEQQQLDALVAIEKAVRESSAAFQAALIDVMLSGFSTFDANQNSLLSFAELSAMAGDIATADQIQALIAAVDTNGDGQISQLEAASRATTQVADNTAALIDGSNAQIVAMREMINESIINSSRLADLNYTILQLQNTIAQQNDAKLAADAEARRIQQAARASYDVGTAYVPRDMTANIHKGEIIIDPRSSEILRKYGIDTSGAVVDIDPLLEEMKAMRAQLASINKSTGVSANYMKRYDDNDAMRVTVITEPTPARRAHA